LNKLYNHISLILRNVNVVHLSIWGIQNSDARLCVKSAEMITVSVVCAGDFLLNSRCHYFRNNTSDTVW